MGTSTPTRFTIWRCRSCGREWKTKPKRFTPHIDNKRLTNYGRMLDCEKPNVFKITYAVTEMVPVR